METRKIYTLSFKKTLNENNGNISATFKICSVDRKNSTMEKSTYKNRKSLHNPGV